MIIEKTTNGDRFINEAETLQVNHIKDNAQVEVWPSRWGNQQQIPQYYIIEHVEQVIYTDHPHEVDWVDKGSGLSKEHSEHLTEEQKEKLRKIATDFINVAVCGFEWEIDEDNFDEILQSELIEPFIEPIINGKI